MFGEKVLLHRHPHALRFGQRQLRKPGMELVLLADVGLPEKHLFGGVRWVEVNVRSGQYRKISWREHQLPNPFSAVGTGLPNDTLLPVAHASVV